MRREIYRYVRCCVYGLIGLWVLLNLVGWGFCGSYAEVGVGMRLVGFLLWGGLLSLGPVLLAAPPSTGKGVMIWEAPLSLPRAVSLLCWLGALVWSCSVPLQAPGNVRSDAELLTYVLPLLMLLWLVVGVPVVSLLVWALQAVFRFFCRL